MKEVNVKRNVAYSMIYQVLTIVLPFVTAPYVSRVLGADGVGIYGYTHSIQTYFSLFAALGTSVYGVREIARARDDEQKRSKLFFEIELLTVFTTMACLIVWVGFILFSKEYKIYYMILTLNILATMFDISWFYTGVERLKHVVFQNLLFKILGVVAIFVFVKERSDLAIYLIIMSASTLLSNISMWIYLPQYIVKISMKGMKISSHFKETMIYFVPTIATSIYTVLDKTLIGIITKNEYENGYYEQATKIIHMAKTVTFTAINTVLGARISYLFAEKKVDEIKVRIKKSIDYVMFIGIGCIFGLIGTARRFVPLFFGEGYEPVVTLIYIFAPIVLIIGISNCLGSQYYNPAGLRKKSAKFIILGSFCNLILNLVLIPNMGSYGAAVASVIAEVVITILYMRNCDGFLHVKTLWECAWKRIIAGAIMLLVVIGVGTLKFNSLLVVGTQVIGGIGIYAIILLLLRDTLLKEVLASVIKRRKNG